MRLLHPLWIILLGLLLNHCVLDLGESHLEMVVDVSNDILPQTDSIEALAVFPGGDSTDTLVLYRGSRTQGVFAQSIPDIKGDTVHVYVKQFDISASGVVLLRHILYIYSRINEVLTLVEKRCLFPTCTDVIIDVQKDILSTAQEIRANAIVESRPVKMDPDSLRGIFSKYIAGMNIDTLDIFFEQYDENGDSLNITKYTYLTTHSPAVLLKKTCVYPKCLEARVDLSSSILPNAENVEVKASINNEVFVLDPVDGEPGVFFKMIFNQDSGNVGYLVTQYDGDSNILVEAIYALSPADTLVFLGVTKGDECLIISCNIDRRISKISIITDTTSSFGTASLYHYTSNRLDSITVYNGELGALNLRSPSGVRRFNIW